MHINPDTLATLKQSYPPNTRIKLIHMDDPRPVPAGTCGTVQFIDDIGQIHMKWDNGSTLALNPVSDRYEPLV